MRIGGSIRVVMGRFRSIFKTGLKNTADRCSLSGLLCSTLTLESFSLTFAWRAWLAAYTASLAWEGSACCHIYCTHLHRSMHFEREAIFSNGVLGLPGNAWEGVLSKAGILHRLSSFPPIRGDSTSRPHWHVLVFFSLEA